MRSPFVLCGDFAFPASSAVGVREARGFASGVTFVAMAYEQGDEITLRGMTFHTLIGVLPHEREHPQPLDIDLTVWMREDQSILDYRRLYAAVRAAVDSPALFYLEELAESIAARVLGEPSVRRARVAIRKPHVAIGGPLRDVEVAIVRPPDA